MNKRKHQYNRQTLDRYCVSPVDIEPRRAGKFRIERDRILPGQAQTLVSFRTALANNTHPAKLANPFPSWVHKLTTTDGDSVLMTDHPSEMYDFIPILQKARSTVFVGGLGLGYVVAQLAEKPEVSKVIVIELEPDIIELVSPFLSRYGDVIEIYQGDIFADTGRILKDCQRATWACLDTWYATGEDAWTKHVVPLRRLLARLPKNRRLVGDRVYCWKEDEMRWQIRSGVLKAAVLTEYLVRHDRAYWAFHRAVREVGLAPTADIEKIEDLLKQPDLLFPQFGAEMHDPYIQQVNRLASDFVEQIGLPHWEELYGPYWDAWTPTTPAPGSAMPAVRFCNTTDGEVADMAD